MTILFCDSFDHYATADVLQKWTAYESSIAGQSLASAGGRRGSNGWTSSAALRGLNKALATSVDTVIVGMAIYYPTLPSITQVILDFYETAQLHLTIELATDGSLHAFRAGSFELGTGTAAGVITTSGFHYVEVKVKIHDTTGTVDIMVNNVSVLSLSGQDTRNGGVAGLVSLVAFEFATTGSFVDDFYLCDNLGGVNNDFLGDVRIDWLPANANGAVNQFTRSGGAANFEMVDDATPDGDTTNNSDSTSAHQDLYDCASMAHTPNTIMGLQGICSVKKGDSGNRSHKPLIRSGTTIYPGSNRAIITTYTMPTDIRETDPNTAVAWVAAGVNAVQVGSEVV